MKKSYRYLGIIVALLVIAYCFSASRTVLPDNTNLVPNPASPPPNEKTVIRIIRWSDGDLSAFEAALDNFNNTNAYNIKAECVVLPQDRFVEMLNMRMSSGETADILGLKSEQVFYYGMKGWIADLRDKVDLNIIENYPDWAWQYQSTYQYSDAFYAIPSTQITYRLLYNRSLFDQADLSPDLPPATMAELEAFAHKISDKGIGVKQYGLGIPLADEWNGFVQSMEAPLTRSGIYYFNYNSNRYTLQEYEPWLSLIGDLSAKGGLYPGWISLKQDTVLAQFSQGNIGMIFATSGDSYILTEKYKTQQDWQVALPPVFKAEDLSYLKIDPGVCYAINQASPNFSQAVKVWEYFHSTEYLQAIFEAGAEIPADSSIWQDKLIAASDNRFSAFLPSEEECVYPPTPAEMDQYLRLNLYRTIAAGSEYAYDLKEAEREYNSIYDTEKMAPSFPVGRYHKSDISFALAPTSKE